MAINLFIQIDNPNLPNQIIIQDNEATTKVLPPPQSLVLPNRIIKIIINEILANCIIKGGPLRKMMHWIWAAYTLNWLQHHTIQIEEIKEYI